MRPGFGTILVWTIWMLLAITSAQAAKGDRQITLPRTSPFLANKVLDLRFADFATGIWARRQSDCADFRSVDQGTPGSVVAIFRGLFETPGQICHVYGAEQRPSVAQRAAMSCALDTGGSALGLVTVRQRGAAVLLIQDGEQAPVPYRLCKKITPILQPVSQ